MLLKIRQQLLPNKIKTTKARQRSTKKLPENYGKKNFVPPPVSSIHPFSFFFADSETERVLAKLCGQSQKQNARTSGTFKSYIY